MRRRFLVPIGLVLVVTLAAAATSAPTARLFPADTFLYVEADANTLEAGLRQLDLARLIQDPEVKACLQPALRKLGLDPEKPLESLLAGLPVKDWLDGHVAIGLRGFILNTERPDGTIVTTRISPDHPIDAKLVHEVLGMVASAQLGRLFGTSHGPLTLRVRPDMLLSIQPGPAARRQVMGFLQSPPPGFVHEQVEIGGKQVLHFKFTQPMDRDVVLEIEAYADFSGATFLIGTDRESFAAALAGGPGASLDASKRFDVVRKRLSSGGQTLFAYLDVGQLLGMASSFIMPIIRQEAEILGLSSVRGLGMSLSFVDGGVRESFALVFDGRPRGLFRLLDAMPTGLKTVDIAPVSTAGFMAMKFDLATLHEQVKELAAILAPGTETYVDPALAMLSEQIGLSVKDDLIPAFGSEVSFLVFPPRGAMTIPQVVMLAKIENEERFGRVLEVAKQYLPLAEMEMRELPMTDGPAGFWLHNKSIPVQPAFAVRHGYLIGAIGPAQLRSFVRNWGKRHESGKSLAGEAVYKRVLSALGAGNGEKLAMYGFMNLKRAVPPALNTALLFTGEMPGLEDWIDLAQVPDGETVGNHLGGIGFAVQRDGQALSLDVFSPTGVLPLAAVLGVAMEQQQRQRQQRWQREMEERVRRSERDREEAAKAADRERQMAEKARAEEPFIGFNLDQTAQGPVRFASIIPGTPAEAASLQAGDVVMRVGETEVADYEAFRAAILKYKPGDSVVIGVKRGDGMVYARLKLGRRGDFVR